jgi:hypothetical protein
MVWDTPKHVEEIRYRYVIKNVPLVGVIEETSHTTHYLISQGVAVNGTVHNFEMNGNWQSILL